MALPGVGGERAVPVRDRAGAAGLCRARSARASGHGAWRRANPYFNDWLAWAGITDITEIHFRPNLVTADAAAARQAAHAAARQAAAKI